MSALPVLALDVGGSSVKSALIAANRRILGDVRVDAMASQAAAPEILSTLAAIVSSYPESRKIRGLALAFPGPFDYIKGISWIQGQGKYESLYGLPVGDGLRDLLDLPDLEIRYRNDAEAAILGEARYGAGAPYSRLLGLTVGTGLGSAFLVDGEIVTDSPKVPNQGWLYALPFGTKRADDVFSTRGLLARFQERGVIAADVASALQAAGSFDSALAESFSTFGTDLGTFLQPFVALFDAQAVLITGGLAATWERFAPSLQRSLSLPVVKGALGAGAALLGAASLYF